MKAVRHNILFIWSDQHGAAYSGCYGHPVVKTPNLDRLATRAVRFDHTYCPSPLCVPSRMAFMTGRRVQNTEVWDNGIQLPVSARTLGHRLTESGYDAILCGRMHFNGTDKTHGFKAQIARDPDADHSTPDWHSGGRIADAAPLPPNADSAFREKMAKRPKVGKGERLDDIATDRAVEFLQSEAANGTRPWALMVGLKHPHGPWNAEQEYWDLYDLDTLDMPPPPVTSDAHPMHQRNRRLKGASEKPLDDATTRRLIAGYYAVISRMDAKVGAILDALEASGQADNTIIVYTSDHGEMLGRHNLWMKSSLFEDAIRVPLLIVDPRASATGNTVATPVSLLDLSATLCDWAGADTEGMDGHSLAPLIHDPATPWTHPVLVEHYGTWTDRPLAAYLKDDFKLICSHNEPPQLFNLHDDAGETRDLASLEDCAATRHRLESEMATIWDSDELLARVLASQKERMQQ